MKNASRQASPPGEGWTRRSVAKGDRLSEIEALYRELGFEVVSLPFAEAGAGGEDSCTACYVEEEGDRVVFTRPKG